MSNLIKRTLPVILVLAVTISCLISPAAAADFEQDLMIDALPYQDSNSFYYFPNATSYKIPIVKPSTSAIRYVEAFILTSTDNISGSFFGTYHSVLNFTSIPCGMVNGNYLFKLVWKGFTSQNNIDIYLNSTNTMNFVNLLSLKYSISSVTVDDLYGYCNIQAVGMSDTIVYRPNDTTNSRNWTPVGTAFNSYQLNLWAVDVEAYDYLNFLIYASVGSVTSINVWQADNSFASVPFEVNYLDNGPAPGTYYISVTVDIRNIDKTLGSPQVIIEGDLYNDQPNHISVDSITGWYELAELNPVIYWLKNIKANLSTWFGQLITSVNSLANGSTQDQTNASDFNAAVSDQQQELEDMAGVMDSVTRPALDDVDVNFDQYVSQDDISGMTSPLEALFTGDIFGVVLIMSIMMGTVSFVFYGKR